MRISDWSSDVCSSDLCAVGAFAAGRLADAIGRRAVMMLSALVFILSALLAGAAPTDIIFIFARFFAGLAVGPASVLAPVYIREVPPASVRARLSTLQQVMTIAVASCAFLVNLSLAHHAGDAPQFFYLGYPGW